MNQKQDRALRKLKKMLENYTQSEIADALEYSQAYISQIANGKIEPTEAFCLRLAEIS